MQARATPIAAIVFGVCSAVAVVTMPMLVGIMIESMGLTPAQAARIASIELGGVAIGAFVVSALITKTSLRVIAFALTAGILAGDLITAQFGSNALYIARFLAGCGEGGAIALAGGVISGTRSPDRYFALFFVAYLATATIAFQLIGSGGLAPQAIYLLLAGIAAVGLLVTIAWLKNDPPEASAVGGVGSPVNWTAIGIALAGMFFFFVGNGSVWVFMERIGVSAGMDENSVRTLLGNATLGGACGAVLAAFVGTRLGRTNSLVLGGIGLIACLASLAIQTSPSVFSIAAIGFVFSWMFTIPFLMGTLASYDPRGRAASASVGLQNAGQAIGPGLASLIITGNDYRLIVILGGVCLAVAFVLYALAHFTSHSVGQARTP